jgi:hypothetical protein
MALASASMGRKRGEKVEATAILPKRGMRD